MQFLDEQTLEDLNVRWLPKEFRAWTIEPYGSGVIAITHSKDATRTAKFACVENQLLLAIEDKSVDVDAKWLNDAVKVVTAVCGFDRNFAKDALKAKVENETLKLEFALPGINGEAIAASKWSAVGVEGPRYMWGPFTYEIPKKNIEAAIKLVLKNPIYT